jgi:A/G-specific adenine glycosylase
MLAWFLAHQRKLPWRERPSLYKTVVSEFMLQQTQVDTVLPYFAHWMQRWPDFTALATAETNEVVHAWEGLGYYNRARNLLRLAIQVAAMHEPPRTAAAWLAMPGVGPYTAAAIASLACGENIAVVDGNVVRVLARLTADVRVFKSNGDAVKAFGGLAQALANPANPGDHNQAMMELGATICRPRKPLCITCPVLEFCAASACGTEEDFPHMAPRNMQRLALSRLWLVHDGRLLLQRHADSARRLQGLHELPLLEIAGKAGQDATLLARKRRAISNQQLEESCYRLDWTPALGTRIATANDLHWIPLAELPSVTLSGPHRKWIPSLASFAENSG